MSTGTLTELDLIDGLGWIDMDDGSRLRVGGTVLSPLRPLPAVGTRLRVLATAEGFRGVLKAISVELADPPPSPPLSWSNLVERFPRWSDAASLCLRPALSAPAVELPEHPLFALWRKEILDESPIVVPLEIPSHGRQAPVEPTPQTTFALGEVAYLDAPAWPECGRCGAPLEHCIHVEADVLAPFGGGGRSLAVLFCFACGVAHRDDPGVAHVAWVRGLHRVQRPAGAPSSSSRPPCATQAVDVRAPMRDLLGVSWLRLRSERHAQSAASRLFGYDARPLCGPFPPALAAWVDEADLREPLDADAIADALEDWLADAPGPAPRGDRHGAYLGGVPLWDQADQTPECAGHGAMRLLLDYEGGQFLDGALHVFTCTECARLAFVAEF